MRNLTPLRPALVALSLIGAIPSAGMADGAPVLSAAQYAPAALRQDALLGVYETRLSPEHDILFVASSPGFEAKQAGFLYVLDPETLSEIRRIQLPRKAFALGLDQAAGRLYVGNTLDGSLTVVDGASGLVIDTIQLGKAEAEGGFEHTRMIRIDQTSGLVFVSSPSETGTVWIVDGREGKLLHRIENTGLWAAGLAYDAAAGKLYVSGGGPEEISVIDVATGKKTGGMATGDTSGATKDDSKHFFVNLAIDTQTQRLFATDGNTSQIYVFDIASGKPVATLPLPIGALDVAFNPVRQEIYATYRGNSREKPDGTGGVAVFDAKTLTPLKTLDLPVHPNSLEIAPDGEVLYVSVKGPHEDTSPHYRLGGTESVVRFDLKALAGLGR